jgi:hypothetical protein
VSVSRAVQQLVWLAFMVTWAGGNIALYFRYRAKQRDLLRRLPPVEGIPLDMYVGGGPRSALRAIKQVMWSQQEDPELEQTRREMWWRYRHMVIWLVGFPLVFIGVVGLIIATGLVHLL